MIFRAYPKPNPAVYSSASAAAQVMSTFFDVIHLRMTKNCAGSAVCVKTSLVLCQHRLLPESLRKFEIPGHVTIASGNGGLPKINVATGRSTAEIYLHGAHVTGFQKNGEPPLLFVSAKSHFAPGKPIRGGVPICFPWFGNREGEPSHGFARILGMATGRNCRRPGRGGDVALSRCRRFPDAKAWKNLRTEFIVTVADTLTMELITTNESCGRKAGDRKLSAHLFSRRRHRAGFPRRSARRCRLTTSPRAPTGARKLENDPALRITKETNRVYPDTTGAVEIRDENLKRTIRVEKFNSHPPSSGIRGRRRNCRTTSTRRNTRHMVCVESGNVKQNKISLAPGKTASLKVVLSSQPL